MTTLLPLATYSASGTGASVDLGVYRALRGTVDVTAYTAPAGTFTLETSNDGTAWRSAGTWDTVTETGQTVRVFGGLSRFVRAKHAGGTVEAVVEAEPVQVYATIADFGLSGLATGAFTGISQPQIWAALEGASRLIDDYLGARVGLPLVVFANASLRRAACVIATYDLLSTIGYNPEGDSENFRLRYLDILKWLAEIRDGDAPLPGGIVDSTPVLEGAPEVVSDEARGW